MAHVLHHHQEASMPREYLRAPQSRYIAYSVTTDDSLVEEVETEGIPDAGRFCERCGACLLKRSGIQSRAYTDLGGRGSVAREYVYLVGSCHP